ncbi:riboflavin kinase [Streptomyces canus]|uniref:riboflavin kinase n=1 Tax=Streptomyces canus TaxID=58343 RepID=UPI003699DB2B
MTLAPAMGITELPAAVVMRAGLEGAVRPMLLDRSWPAAGHRESRGRNAMCGTAIRSVGTPDGVTDASETCRSDVAEAPGPLWVVRGVIVSGKRRGRDLGFPTANVQTEGAGPPQDGVYAGFLTVAGTRRPAAISVGTNPTFREQRRTVEAHVLDFDGRLYGQVAEVEGHHRLRGMTAFGSVAELVDAMADDVSRTRDLMYPAASDGGREPLTRARLPGTNSRREDSDVARSGGSR